MWWAAEKSRQGEANAVSGKHRMTAELMEPARIRQHRTTECLSSPHKQLAFIKRTKSVCIPPVENAAGRPPLLAISTPSTARGWTSSRDGDLLRRPAGKINRLFTFGAFNLCQDEPIKGAVVWPRGASGCERGRELCFSPHRRQQSASFHIWALSASWC